MVTDAWPKSQQVVLDRPDQRECWGFRRLVVRIKRLNAACSSIVEAVIHSYRKSFGAAGVGSAESRACTRPIGAAQLDRPGDSRVRRSPEILPRPVIGVDHCKRLQK